MDKNKLESIGLTSGESKVYLALLSLNTSSKSAIVKESGVSSSKVYEILDRLLAKGLISTFLKNKVKQYCAASPSNLLDYANKKQERLNQEKERIVQLIPQLEQIKDSDSSIFTSVTYEGIAGIQTAMNELLNQQSDEYYAMGVTSQRNPLFNREWYHWHTKRITKNISAKLLFTESKSDYNEKLSNLTLTQIRFGKWVTPATIGIMGDKVIIVDYTAKVDYDNSRRRIL